jgi:type IV pilus assembly protein PilN
MANINLLPWRDAQRSERNRETLIMCVAIWIVACLVVFGAKLFMDSRIEHQQARNAFVQSEINALSKVIREIETLKDKRDALLARMDVIQNLQKNRSQIVHVFDDLSKKLPKGVFYEAIGKKDKIFRIAGRAQSNGRVSALMRSLDSSDWFDNATLDVVNVDDQNGTLISKFNMQVKEQRNGESGANEAEQVR